MTAVADPLREYAESTALLPGMSIREVRDELQRLADEIDREHERQMVELLRHDRSLARKIKHGNGEYGHTTCSACGVTVHRRDKWCWSCGARLHGEIKVVI